MTEKLCTTCNEVKDISFFSKASRNKSGFYYRCKPCQKRYAFENAEKIKSYRKSKAVERKNYMKKWNEINRAHVLEYRERTKESKILTQKIYYQKNKKKCQQRNDKRHKQRVKEDPLYLLASSARAQVRHGLKMVGTVKTQKSNKYLGISYEKLKTYLEKKFKKGMTWQNHGIGKDKWNIDHIIPLASAKTEEEMIVLLHYRNLQPLWSTENLKKWKKIPNAQVNLPL